MIDAPQSKMIQCSGCKNWFDPRSRQGTCPHESTIADSQLIQRIRESGKPYKLETWNHPDAIAARAGEAESKGNGRPPL